MDGCWDERLSRKTMISSGGECEDHELQGAWMGKLWP